ncbi:MAG TPA: hypothetical protein VIL46_03125, partial [Gemmataceae bacterium]
PGRLERSWDVTSDSIAARAAEVSGAGRLVLLKSVAMEPFAGWEDASARGWVDAAFPRVLAAAMRSRPLRAEAVPFPDWLARWRGE